MAAGDSGDKTEKPTPKRLKEARDQGQIARSPDLSGWVSVLATTVLIQMTVRRGASVFRNMLEQMGLAVAHPDVGVATRFAADSIWKAIGVVAPMLIGMLVIVLVVNVAQVGFKPTSKKLKPDFKKLNPLKGLKRMVSTNAWWELAKSLAKTALLFAIAWPAMTHAMHSLAGGSESSMAGIAGLTAATALSIVRNVAVAGLIVAIADYAYQKRRTMKQLRMTRREVREEFKQQEGNPEMRRALRSRAVAISRNRMIHAVGLADVVIVNPTHYAVALRYEQTKGAPQVLAKGAGVIAAAIRAEAEKNSVPIVQEPVLARALYKVCEVGQLIPVDLYEAVAHLLAFVFGLRARGRAQGVHELPRTALL
jgi:flagellar biosynthetic protein FlhB